MSEAGHQRTAQQGNRPGRHRRNTTAGTWTPAVDPAGSSGRHRAHEAPAAVEPARAEIATISGELPLPRAAETTAPTPKPAVARTAVALAQKPEAARTAVALAPEPAPVRKPEGRRPVALTPPQPPVQRTKVTLAPAVQYEEDDDALVYLAAPLDGLGAFDLGSVPASVTAPRSWRKAAWFATVSSGGVAVALLLAGSYLVGQPVQTNDAQEGWVGLHGKPPVVTDEGFTDTDPTRSTNSPLSSSPGKHRIADAAATDDSSTGGSPDGAESSVLPSGTPTSTADGAPSSSPEPQKPPPRDAPRETRSDAVYKFPPNAETMGDRSETFLNEITENPQIAHEQTGGELYAEGADGIAQRYEHIAYFEVEHIYIDQKDRVTVNTVHVVYQDGTEDTMQCTLRFQEDDRITDDCMP
jgi:hypothetical protein